MKNNYLDYLSVIHAVLIEQADSIESLIEYSDDGIGTPMKEAKETAGDVMIPIVAELARVGEDIKKMSLKDLKKKYL